MTTRLLAPRDSLPAPPPHADDTHEGPKTSGSGADARTKHERTAVLLGNLNVGKTTLFNRVCGRRSKVANYPGTTISVGRGTFPEAGGEIHLIDTPGIDGMMPDSEDEKISRDILLDERPEVIAIVADGKNLRKSLLLTSQLAEYEMPLLIDINMMDEVRQRGIRIDAGKLSSLIGVPVTATTATEGEGVEAFKRGLNSAGQPRIRVSYPLKVEAAISLITKLLKDTDLPPRAMGTAMLAGDEGVKRYVAARCGEDVLEQIEAVADHAQSAFSRPLSGVILESRLRTADEIISEVYSVTPPARMPLSEKIGEWSRRPLTGIPIAALVVVLMYLFVGRFGAGVMTDLFQGRLFDGGIVPITRMLVARIPFPFVSDALVGPFGLVTVGLSGAFGVVLPVLVTFFFVFGFLEDSGYLPRLSILLDRLFRIVGLNGKGVFPLVMGYSCVTMAVLTTRVLETKRERFIATLLVLISGPCAPLLAVMLVLLAKMSIWALVSVFALMFVQTFVAGLLADKILPGPRSDFILELPPIRIPKMRSLVEKTLRRTWWFAREAFPYFILAAFSLFLLEKVGVLILIEKVARPVLTRFLGLPPESVEVAIVTLIRKESGAALLKQLGDAGRFDNVQLLVSIFLLTFLLPCVNTVLVMIKERGARAAMSIIAVVGVYALGIGAVVNFVCRTLGVTFK